MRRFHFALFAVLTMFSAPSLVASTFYVGTCRSRAFGTIQAAVSSPSVSAGSIIDVCPGTYPEQVVISKQLTLHGISSNNSSQAVITVPSAGLLTTTSISFGGTVAAQVEVTAAGVNISGIAVDGTASSSNCPSISVPYIGIFYSSGSSGTISGVETLNQNCNGAGGGVGIMAENGAGTAQSVTVENSDVNNNGYAGIWVCSDQTPSTLTASIKGNYIAGGLVGLLTECNNGNSPNYVAGSVSSNNISGNTDTGVYVGSDSIAVSGNTITSGFEGIQVYAKAVVSSNTVVNSPYGIDVLAAGSVSSNHISNSSVAGIALRAAGASVKTNSITQSGIGIEFFCYAGTVSGNTINGATTGIHQVPTAFTGVNIFHNVATVRLNGGLC